MTTPNIPAIQLAIKVLNEALEADRVAMNALLKHSVECNWDLGDHWSIQVGAYDPETDDETDDPLQHGPYRVRLLGVINGLFGIGPDSWGFIVGYTDEHGDFTRFEYRPPRQPARPSDEASS